MSPPVEVPDLAGRYGIAPSAALDMQKLAIVQAFAEVAAELAALDPTVLARRPALRRFADHLADLAIEEEFMRAPS